jgi:hypothetical protein
MKDASPCGIDLGSCIKVKDPTNISIERAKMENTK